MLRLFDPTIEVDEAEDKAKRAQMHTLIPLYQKPQVTFTILPGDYFYLHVRKPQLVTKVDKARQDANYVSTTLENNEKS